MITGRLRWITVFFAFAMLSPSWADQTGRSEIYIPYWPECDEKLRKWVNFWKPYYDDWDYEVILPDTVPGIRAPVNGLVKFRFPAEQLSKHKELAESFQFHCSPTSMIAVPFEGIDEDYIRGYIARSPAGSGDRYEGFYLIRVVGDKTEIFFNSGANRGESRNN